MRKRLACLRCIAVLAMVLGLSGCEAGRAWTVYADWPFDAAEARRGQRETASRLGIPVERSLPLGNGVGLDLVLIPAGRFLMGSPESEPGREADEGPQHWVHITRPFYIGKYEVTQAQCEALAGENPSYPWGAACPVGYIYWPYAWAFCELLSCVTGARARLPTEAEWEYACRAGTTTPYHVGRFITVEQARFDGDHDGVGHVPSGPWGPRPVGSFAPNAWGIHDMHGNVEEWCEDVYDANYYGRSPARNPLGPHGTNQRLDRRVVVQVVDHLRGPVSSTDRVCRGGDYGGSSADLRSASRYDWPDFGTSGSTGFRVVVSTAPARSFRWRGKAERWRRVLRGHAAPPARPPARAGDDVRGAGTDGTPRGSEPGGKGSPAWDGGSEDGDAEGTTPAREKE